ncbi:MAG: hypothetical protein KatS3mg126_1414 [Lysobacteraceae bacterium]|nr:MAG: hypothetical protein KatS3mg126_1414 [Xanthomonadaceae bacterium]
MTEDPPPPQPAPPPAPSSGPDPAGTPGADERQWALFAHLSALAGFLIPFGNILGPLIVWQIKKNEMPFVDDQGKEALNFQITVLIAVVVCLVLSVLLIGLLLLPVVAVADLVLTIVAAIKANQGETYRYPFTLRLIS